MNEPEPVYLGAFQPMKRGDILDRYIDISADLVSARGETIETATFTVTAAGSEDPIGSPPHAWGQHFGKPLFKPCESAKDRRSLRLPASSLQRIPVDTPARYYWSK